MKNLLLFPSLQSSICLMLESKRGPIGCKQLHLFLSAVAVMLSGSVIKSTPANAGDTRDVGSILGWGRYTGGRNGNAL